MMIPKRETKQYSMWINGLWVEAQNGKRFTRESPSEGVIVGEYPQADKADTDAAGAAAASVYALLACGYSPTMTTSDGLSLVKRFPFCASTHRPLIHIEYFLVSRFGIIIILLVQSFEMRQSMFTKGSNAFSSICNTGSQRAGQRFECDAHCLSHGTVNHLF